MDKSDLIISGMATAFSKYPELFLYFTDEVLHQFPNNDKRKEFLDGLDICFLCGAMTNGHAHECRQDVPSLPSPHHAP